MAIKAKIPIHFRALNFLCLSQLTGNANSLEILTFTHPLASARAQYTALLLAQRLPILRSYLRRTWRGYFWREFPGPLTLLTEISLPEHLTPAQVQIHLQKKAWEIPLNPLQQPPVKLLLAHHHGQQQSYLLVLSHHMASDAMSGLHLVQKFCEIYDGRQSQTAPPLALALAPLSASQDWCFFQQSLPKVGLVRSFYFFLWFLWANVLILRDLFSPRKTLPTSATTSSSEPHPSFSPYFLLHTFTDAALTHVKNLSQQQQVGMHALLTSLLAENFKLFWQRLRPQQVPHLPRTLRLMDTYSLRPRYQQDPHIQERYDLLMIPFTHDLSLQHSPSQRAIQSQKLIAGLKGNLFYREFLRQKSYALLAPWIPLGLVPLTIQGLCRFILKSNIVFTNVGAYPSSLQGFQSLQVQDFYQFTVCLPPGKLALTFNSFRGQLRMTLVSDEKFLTQEEAQKFLQFMEVTLLASYS